MKFKMIGIIILAIGIISCTQTTDETKNSIEPTRIYKSKPIYTNLKYPDEQTNNDTTYWYYTYELGGKDKSGDNNLYTKNQIFAGHSTTYLININDSPLDKLFKRTENLYLNFDYYSVTFYKQISKIDYARYWNNKDSTIIEK